MSLPKPSSLDKRPAPSFAGRWVDDGDAMRLVVQLRIDIEFDGEKVQAWFVAPRPGWENGAVYQWIEPLGDDPYAATRRAIVHAAAEMSKTPNAEIRGGEAVPLD